MLIYSLYNVMYQVVVLCSEHFTYNDNISQ